MSSVPFTEVSSEKIGRIVRLGAVEANVTYSAKLVDGAILLLSQEDEGAYVVQVVEDDGSGVTDRFETAEAASKFIDAQISCAEFMAS